MQRKSKKVSKFTLLHCVVFALALSSCVSETKFEADTSKTDTGGEPDMKVKKPDVVQRDCDPVCGTGEVCKTDGFVCVACLGDSDCTDQLCDTDSNICVDCKDNSTCTEVAGSLCTSGECGACVMDADCEHLTDTPLCDAGTCKLKCETDAHCGGKVCDVTTNLCTTDDPNTLGQCLECVSDTQCSMGYHCVPLGFGKPDPTPRGNYCLQIRPAGGCDKPYRVDIERISLNGAAAERHCGVNETLTTCEAVLAATNSTFCKDGADDTVADPSKCIEEGARCEDLSGGWTCTYNCNNSRQCSSECIDAVAPSIGKHCN